MVFVNSFSQVKFPEVKGWELSKTVNNYNSDNLWNIIDGAADLFVKYEFREMNMTEYIRKDSVYITVEVYRHADNEYAWGVYNREKPSRSIYISIGTEGYSEPGLLNCFYADCYIKLRCNNSDNYIQNAMQEITKGIISSIPKSSSKPEVLNLFPKEGLIKGSEQLVATNFLGIKFLKKVYQADYTIGESNFNVFIIKSTESDELLKKYFEYAKAKPELQKNSYYKVEDPNNGVIYLFPRKDRIFGFVGLEDQKIFKKIEKWF